MWIVRIGLSYVFAWWTDLGPMSIWYAMMIDWAVRTAFFVLRWARGGWKKHCRIGE
jgi:Na+-driven multidrug efflux pump